MTAAPAISPDGTDAFNFNQAGIPASGLLTGQDCCKTQAEVDLFGGSGSTLIDCERRGRKARLMEIDPKYADVIVQRWEQLAGKKATLEADGRTFAGQAVSTDITEASAEAYLRACAHARIAIEPDQDKELIGV